MIKAIIFDFDGVLVESTDIKTEAFAKLFCREDKENVKKIIDYHTSNAGISRFEKFRYIYENILKRRLSEQEFNVLCYQFSALVFEAVIKAPYVKGAREFLESNKVRYNFFVVSATPQKEIEEIVKKRKMDIFFKDIYGAPTKKEDAVKEIMLKNNFPATDVIYMGDAQSDYDAAVCNSIMFIARIKDNERIFCNLSCQAKVPDFHNLEELVSKL